MTATTCLVTRDAETGYSHVIAAPDARAIEAVVKIEGSALLVVLAADRRTARLLRVIRGRPEDFIAWCRRSGYRPLDLPDGFPGPAVLAARPNVTI
jgi:hypothetical protein